MRARGVYGRPITRVRAGYEMYILPAAEHIAHACRKAEQSDGALLQVRDLLAPAWCESGESRRVGADQKVQEVMGVQIALQTLEADRTLDKVEYLQELLRSTPMGDPEGARLLSEYEVAFQDVVQKLNQAGEMFEKVFHLRCHDLPGMGRLRRLATAYARGVARAASFSA